MIEDVETLEAQLYLSGLTQLSDRISLEDTEIEVHRARTIHDVTPRIAVVILRRGRECRQIEPVIDAALVLGQRAVADAIGTRCARVRRAYVKRRSEGMAVADGGDSIQLPV